MALPLEQTPHSRLGLLPFHVKHAPLAPRGGLGCGGGTCSRLPESQTGEATGEIGTRGGLSVGQREGPER